MPALVWAEPPAYDTLRCPGDPNHRDFCEYAYVACSQPFVRPDAGEEPDWDSFDYDVHHPYIIECQECGETVWEAMPEVTPPVTPPVPA
jgi:hypothetical protein